MAVVNLCMLDYTSVIAYTNDLFRIISTLTTWGEPVADSTVVDKTLSTFHPSNLILATRYCNTKFAQYLELTSHLLVAKKQLTRIAFAKL